MSVALPPKQHNTTTAQTLKKTHNRLMANSVRTPDILRGLASQHSRPLPPQPFSNNITPQGVLGLTLLPPTWPQAVDKRDHRSPTATSDSLCKRAATTGSEMGAVSNFLVLPGFLSRDLRPTVKMATSRTSSFFDNDYCTCALV